MARITITVPEKIRAKAERQAKQRGLSLGDFVRNVLTEAVNGAVRKTSQDSFLADTATYDGPVPPDLSLNHDDYLYGPRDLH
jgi:hypothetical protein